VSSRSGGPAKSGIGRLGLSHVAVRSRVIAIDDEAREHAFVGSPMFSVNYATRSMTQRNPAVSCRLYRTSSDIALLPEIRML
jgi:hypothetical protein